MKERQVKTLEDVHTLKENWKADPSWDIETTEGFEEYRAHLLAFRLNYDSSLEERRVIRLLTLADEWDCSVELVKYVDRLESRIKHLEQRDEH